MNLNNNTFLQGGKYQVVRFLSSGGFGNTYEGVHMMMDTRVAIKEFFPKMFCNRDENTSHVTVATQSNRELVDKLRKKFNEEAKSVFKMKHDNIVRVLDIFEENGTAYYVMEYIDGKSLNEITKERGALPESEAVGYILQVADALKYVHSLNRLHLDIKPGNIMVDKNGKAILIDFGASKHYDDESGENTSTLMGVNTKGYAPIEQSTQSFTSFSPATDIYALGATLYKLLTGVTPPDANLLLVEEETLPAIPNSISSSVKNAVMSAMSLKRKNRPQNIDSFLFLFNSVETRSSETVNDESTLFTTETIEIKKDYSLMPLEELKSYAEQGDRIAQCELAGRYCNSEGVDFSLEDCIFWYRSSANQGYAEAQYEIAAFYAAGFGVDEDIDKAISLYKKAADQGYAKAMYELAQRYEEGNGVRKNAQQATFWYQKSVEALTILYEQGNPEAANLLGHCYYEGKGVRKNIPHAIALFKKGAENGNENAQVMLASLYYDGDVVEQDYNEAVYWYTKAAEQGNSFAQLMLGDCYKEGLGVDIDIDQAIYWKEMGAENADAETQYTLGCAFLVGKEFPKDLEKAEYWFTKAVEQGYEEAVEMLETTQEMKTSLAARIGFKIGSWFS